MSTPRTSIIAGPARIRLRAQTFFSLGDVIVSTRVRAFEVAAAGRPPQRREDRVDMELTFTPAGDWAPMCASLQALAELALGQDVFVAAGGTMVVESADGWTYTYANAALTAPPPVIFSAGRTLFGAATITALGDPGAAPAAPGRRVAITRSPDPVAPAGDDPGAVIEQPYALSWGGDPAWTQLATADGVALTFAYTLVPRQLDGAGVIGLRLAGLAVTARARPLGVPDEAVFAALRIQGAGAGRGRALGGRGTPDLVVAGAGVYARLYGAGLDAGTSQFGATRNRVGELGWTASVGPAAADGPLRAAFFLGTAPPS